MSEEALSFTIKRTRRDYFWAVMFNALKSPIIPIFFAIALIMSLAPTALIEGGIGVDQVLVAAAIYGALIVLYYVSLCGAVWFTARKNWSAPGALEPLSYAFSPSGVDVSYSLGHGVTAWPLWRDAFETNSLVVIRHMLGLIHIIPKRGLDHATLARLRAILLGHLGPKARMNAPETA